MSIAAYRAVWTRSRARGAMQHLLLAFADFAAEDGVAWPSVSTIAGRLQITYRHAHRLVVAAVEVGELVRVGTRSRGVVAYRMTCCDAGYVARVTTRPLSKTTEATPVENDRVREALTSVENGRGDFLTPAENDRTPLSKMTGVPLSETTDEPLFEPSLKRKQRNAAAAARETVLMQSVDAWNELAEKHGLVRVARLTDARAAKLAARLDDAGGIGGWCEALRRIDLTPGLLGSGDGWRVGFDWLIDQTHFARLLEGNYDGWDSARPAYGHGRAAGKCSLDPLFDGLAQALAAIEAERDGDG